MQKKVRFLTRETAYDGYFKVNKYRYQQTLFNGGWSPILEREIFARGEVAAVMPYDPDMDAVLLVEQCRAGALDSAYCPWLMEVIAGIIDPGETPKEAVKREALEEAGCGLTALTPIAEFFVSPGGSNELAHLYFATCSLSDVAGVHGLIGEGEDIATHVIARKQAFALLEKGEFKSTKVIIALQWFALNYQRLFAGK